MGDILVKWHRLCLWLMCCLAVGCGGAKTGLPDLRLEAVKLNDAGYQYYRESRWYLAREKFSQALKMNRLIDHRPGIAANLNNLGAIAQEQGGLKEARQYYQEALTIQKDIGEPEGICEALNNLGTVYAALGNWHEAENLYQEAMGYASKLPPGPLLALTLTRQGDVARQRQDFQQALGLYQQALAVDKAKRNRAGMAVRWVRLGRIYLDLLDYNASRRYLAMALKEFRRQEMTSGIIDALDGLTRLALAQRYHTLARRYGERLLNLYEARGQSKKAEELKGLLQPKGRK